MFLVYEENTGKFQTARQYPKLVTIDLSSVDLNKAKLKVSDFMEEIIFDLPKNNNDSKSITMWFDEPVKCLDCGSKVAIWLSKYRFFIFP